MAPLQKRPTAAGPLEDAHAARPTFIPALAQLRPHERLSGPGLEPLPMTRQEALRDICDMVACFDHDTDDELLQIVYDLVTSYQCDPADYPALRQIATRWKRLTANYQAACAVRWTDERKSPQ